MRRTIRVNEPLAYKGIKFYQSSYGLNGMIEITGPDNKTERIPIYKGSCATYRGTGQMFNVEELLPDINTLHGRASNTFEPTQPVTFLIAHDANNSEPVGWISAGKPTRWGQYQFKLVEVKEYTGLQVKRDPGVPLVYLGFILLVAGVGLMLYKKVSPSTSSGQRV
mgnify:CR=1 FL=1